MNITDWIRQARSGSTTALEQLWDAARPRLREALTRDPAGARQQKGFAVQVVDATLEQARREFRAFAGTSESEFWDWTGGLLQRHLADALQRLDRTENVHGDRTAAGTVGAAERSDKTARPDQTALNLADVTLARPAPTSADNPVAPSDKTAVAAASDATAVLSGFQLERVPGLEDALQRLPKDEREVVCLRHIERLPVTEIAKRLGLSLDVVAGLLRRGVVALQLQLAEHSQRSG